MKINTRIRYAVRMMVDITKHSDGQPVPLRDVAHRQGLSKLYLSQLATPLRNASLLRSVWGNKGGYLLGRPADAINLLDVIEAVDGPVSVIECVEDASVCERTPFCDTISVWKDINTELTKAFRRYTLRDLVDRGASEIPPGSQCVSAPKQ